MDRIDGHDMGKVLHCPCTLPDPPPRPLAAQRTEDTAGITEDDEDGPLYASKSRLACSKDYSGSGAAIAKRARIANK